MSNDALLRLLIEQTTEHAVMLVTLDGRIASWNRAAELVFGRSPDEAIGKPLAVLFTPEDIAAGMVTNELLTAAASPGADDDRWLVRKDGSKFWASGVMIALRDPDGKHIAFGKILRNRTDLREQVETLRNQARAADVQSRNKDVFISTLSHELRNPLAPLTHAVELIKLQVPQTPEVDVLVGMLERQIGHLRHLVEDLMDLSRIASGKIAIEKEPVRVSEIIARVAESVRALIERKRHRLHLLLPEGDMVVEGDGARLDQVFINLLTNAAKYTPEGGDIWVKGTTEADEAVVHIQDNGIGIPQEMQSKIFDLFTQVEPARTWSLGGLGIGLSLVMQLVNLHGGMVQVRSDGPGKGSEFTVRLPLAYPEPRSAAL